MRLGLRITIINYVEMNRRIYIQAVDPNNERRPPGLVRHARWKHSTSLGEDNHASRLEAKEKAEIEGADAFIVP